MEAKDVRDITIEITIRLSVFEDRSGLSHDAFNKKVFDYVKEERDELASAARVAAYQLLNGDKEDV